jgi:hypothetical protein
MLPNAACELVYRLDEIILLGVEAHQISLFDPQDEPVIESPKEAVQAVVAVAMGYDSLTDKEPTQENGESENLVGTELSAITPTRVAEGNDKGRLVVVGPGAEGEQQVAGLVMDEEKGELLIQPMGNGEPMSVNKSKINSEMTLVTPPGIDFGMIHESYEKMSDLAGTSPDWADIIESIGLLYAENELKPTNDQEWPITLNVLRRAIEVADTRGNHQ